MRTPDAARDLLDRALKLYEPDAGASQRLRSARQRLDEPLRLAVAGKVKAGKSTLLNALLGEQIAATDAGECTLVTTWYRHGDAPSASVVLRDGRVVPLPLGRGLGTVTGLGGHRPADVARLEVAWPLPFLTTMTLIDTPGIGSLTREASRRTVELIRPEEEGPGVDAVVYLMRHRHAADLELLIGFRSENNEAAGGGLAGVNVIGVLSRADEVGGGGADALVQASRLAASHGADPAMRELCRTVLPVAGLLAQGAQTMTHDEFTTLRAVAELPPAARERLLLSAARFSSADEPGPDADARRALLDRLGLFGVRLGASLVALGVNTPAAMARELMRRSGLPELRASLEADYAQRAELFKASSALRVLSGVLAAHPRRGSDELEDALADVLASAHDLERLRVSAALDADGLPGLTGDAVAAARALLAVPEDAADGTNGVRPDAHAELARWRTVANDPLVPRATRQAAQALGRVCERLIAASAIA